MSESPPVDITPIVRSLVAELGGTLVATLAGQTQRTMNIQWTEYDDEGPTLAEYVRLVTAYRAWTSVANEEGADTARLWFIGSNPWLKNNSIIDAIREDRFEEVERAVAGFLEDRPTF